MTKLKILIFILFPVTSLCQNISLRITSNGEVVPYATVYDSSKNMVRAVNEEGYLVLPAANYNLEISHTSYQSINIQIARPVHDTTVNITLNKKDILIESVVIEANKRRKVVGEVGNGFQNSKNSYVGYPSLGVYVEYPGEEDLQLRSIKFRLKRISSYPRKNYFIEIRIYPVKDFLVSDTPLNKLPIIIPRNHFKIKNEVFVKENITLPPEGVFVVIATKSIEPIQFSVESPSIEFPIHYDNKDGLAYPAGESISKYILQKRQYLKDINGNLQSISLGITYYK